MKTDPAIFPASEVEEAFYVLEDWECRDISVREAYAALIDIHARHRQAENGQQMAIGGHESQANANRTGGAQ